MCTSTLEPASRRRWLATARRASAGSRRATASTRSTQAHTYAKLHVFNQTAYTESFGSESIYDINGALISQGNYDGQIHIGFPGVLYPEFTSQDLGPVRPGYSSLRTWPRPPHWQSVLVPSPE